MSVGVESDAAVEKVRANLSRVIPEFILLFVYEEHSPFPPVGVSEHKLLNCQCLYSFHCYD